MPTQKHIVASYDAQLNKLHETIARMGGLAEAQLSAAMQAMLNRDSDLAGRVMGGDSKVDEFEALINDQTVRLLALRAPVADDLRTVLTALKVASTLERVADYAANAAKRTLVLNQSPPIPPVRAVVRMGSQVLSMLKEVLDAYLERDVERALDVWKRDQEVDDLYSSLFRELLTYMMEDPRNITPGSHLMFIAKNIERVGDHATNIAELTYYMAKGVSLRGERPKGDTTPFVGDPEGPKVQE
ncbi:phosphate signaling complex protein PhoU [Telmatospirillum sp. J64-1]|uniref:phosphate signaling complex protein PhoU n=1 Tax=Telmatospirillum sp. J64-1 TaxID=2502183 RepID=UPI00115D8071|nr:phosphate signaling complex protein PhoU [Telmatospirillum sp. J64-1]